MKDEHSVRSIRARQVQHSLSNDIGRYVIAMTHVPVHNTLVEQKTGYTALSSKHERHKVMWKEDTFLRHGSGSLDMDLCGNVPEMCLWMVGSTDQEGGGKSNIRLAVAP